MAISFEEAAAAYANAVLRAQQAEKRVKELEAEVARLNAEKKGE